MSTLKLDKTLNIDLDHVVTSPYGLPISFNPTNTNTNTLSQSPAPSLLSPANYNLEGFNSPIMPQDGLSSPANRTSTKKEIKLRNSPFSMPYEGFKRPKNMSLTSVDCDDVSTKPSTMTSLASFTKFRVRTIVAPQSLTALPSESPGLISLNNLDAIKKLGVKSLNDVGNRETNREGNLPTEQDEIAQLSSIRERAGPNVEEAGEEYFNADIQEKVKQDSDCTTKLKKTKKVEKVTHNHVEKYEEKRCSCVKHRKDTVKTMMKGKTESNQVKPTQSEEKKQKKVVLKKRTDGKILLKKAKTVPEEKVKELSLHDLTKVHERLTLGVVRQETKEPVNEVPEIKAKDEQEPETPESFKSLEGSNTSLSAVPVEEAKLRRVKRKRSLSTGKLGNIAQERIIIKDEIIKPQEDEKEGSIVVMNLLKRTQSKIERPSINMKVLDEKKEEETIKATQEMVVQENLQNKEDNDAKKPEVIERQENKKLSWLQLRKRQNTEDLRIEEVMQQQSSVNKEPQMFVQGPNHYFELNMENKFLKEYGSLTNISRDILTKTPNYTSVPVSQHSHRDKQPKPFRERKTDASTVIVRYYDEMEPILIQPKFLEATGSMCVTELWGRKNKKDFYHDMRKALRSSTHLCLDPHYGMYRPEKIQDSETLKRKREANSALINGKLGIISQVSATSSPKTAFFPPSVSGKHTRGFVLQSEVKKARNSVGPSLAKKLEL